MTVRPWSTLDVRVQGRVAWVRFDRPAARNAVTSEMVGELHAVLTELSGDDATSVVVLTGAGSTFCPGADLNRSAASGPPALPPLEVYRSATLLHEMPQLTVAAINGGCAGAGFAWASACDLRVASSRARFSTAFLQVGLASELGLPWTLQRSVGGAVARDLCFLPRKLDAEEARRIGFLSRVFPDELFAEEVAALVDELAGRDPTAVRALKENFVLAERTDLAGFVDEEARRHQALFTGRAAAASAPGRADSGR